MFVFILDIYGVEEYCGHERGMHDRILHLEVVEKYNLVKDQLDYTGI